MQHPCEILYETNGRGFSIGNVEGVCRITGKRSVGQKFSDWVRRTFTDFGSLHAGDIISNEAAFCFDEASTLIQQKTGRDKPQRFRTYSHFLEEDGTWHCLTKADKPQMLDLLHKETKIVCVAESGQRHIFFKNKPGMWQIEDVVLDRDIKKFDLIHSCMTQLLLLDFSQDEIRRGLYNLTKVAKCGIKAWEQFENKIKPFRGSPIFHFCSFFMYKNK